MPKSYIARWDIAFTGLSRTTTTMAKTRWICGRAVVGIRMGSASESTGRSSRSAPRTYGEVMDGFEHGLKRATRVWVGELEDKVMRYTPVL